MKKFIYTLVILAFTVTAYAQWVPITPAASLNISAVHDTYFLDANIGFAGGEGSGKGIIAKTNNGGLNWQIVYITNENSDWINSIVFVNINTGFACSQKGYIYKTTNSGNSWFSQQGGIFDCWDLGCIRFINATTGLTCGDGPSTNRGPIWRTADGGLSWVKVYNSTYHMDKIFILDQNTIYASGDYVVLKSTDAGLTWTDIYPGNRDCNDVFFLNSNTGFVCGNFVMLKTSNAGANWTEFTVLPPSDTNYHASVFFTDNSTGYLSLIKISTLTSKIYKTVNSGVNWQLQQNFSGYVASISFLNTNTGYACGSGEKIWKTTNGGGTIGVQNISSEIPPAYSLSQNYPNPFNPTTKIKFDVARLSDVKMVVYDVMGREVQTLVNESLKPGKYEASFDGSQLTSGVYFYKLITGDFVETKKMLMIK